MLKTAVAMTGLLSFYGCDGTDCGDSECRFTSMEWEIVQSLSPLPDVPPDPTNKYADNDAAALLGQKLFFETRYSGGLKVGSDGVNGALGDVGDTELMGCAACHSPSGWFADDRSKPGNTSLGVKYSTRNAPSIVNVAYYRYHGWGGKQDSLWCQASLSPESGTNSAGNRCGYAHMLYDLYRDEYNAIFDEQLPEALNPLAPDADRFPPKCKPKSSGAEDGPYEGMTEADQLAVNRIMANQGKAVAAYERRLVSKNAPFDAYVGGNADAISDEAKRGLKLFVGKAACVDCHNTAFFSDNKFHNIGMSQVGPNVAATDLGRFDGVKKLRAHQFNSLSVFRDGEDPGKITDDLVQADELKGKFRTSALRSVAMTAPYGHTGEFETLADIIQHYNQGGASAGFGGEKSFALEPLFLSDREVADLVAFLESLTGEPIPEALTQDLTPVVTSTVN